MQKKTKNKKIIFFRISRLVWKKKYKAVIKITRNGTLKSFIQANKRLLWIIEKVLPLLITMTIIMFSCIVFVYLGGKLPNNNLILATVIFLAFIVGLLLYDAMKILIKNFLKWNWCMFSYVSFFWIENLIGISNMNFVRNISFGCNLCFARNWLQLPITWAIANKLREANYHINLSIYTIFIFT